MPTPTALITGAAKRIGASLAETFHQAGYRVILHAHHSKAEANTLCDRLNHQRQNSALVLLADLKDPNTPQRLIESSIEWAGQLDVLIHNASCFERDNADDLTLEERLFSVNVAAPYALSIQAQAYLKKQKGSILYLTDIHAFHPLKDYTLYCKSKAALTEQMRSFAQDFAPEIRVNAIAPGAIAWPEGENTLSKAIQEKIMHETLLKTHGKPCYVAQAALTLVQNPFITGVVLPVDGGRSLNFKLL